MRSSIYYFNSSILDKVDEVGKGINNLFKVDEFNAKAITSLMKWFFGQKGKLSKGCYIYGNCGTGKTMLMSVLKQVFCGFKQRFVINGKNVRPYWKTYHASEICGMFRQGQDISFLNTIPMLGIDDIGAESEQSVFMGNRCDVIKELLEIREDKGVITMITSNLNPYSPEFERRYGPRLTSRMRGLNVFELKGPDRRSQQTA